MPGLLARLRARIPLEEGSLVLITMIWGATFIIIRSALEATGPFFFVGVRFAFAALALVLFSLPLLRDFTWREVWAGMSIGLCIFGDYALQTCGLQTITASKSAFITAFYVPLVPLAGHEAPAACDGLGGHRAGLSRRPAAVRSR